jgi:hypothetical protein
MAQYIYLKVLTLIICAAMLDGISVAQQNNWRRLGSSDGAVSLSVPADMDTMSLNSNAVLQVGSTSLGLYLIILNDSKADIEGWNIERHFYVSLGNLLKSCSSPVLEGPKKCMIDSFPAMQCVVRGSTLGTFIVYLATCIETPRVFSYVLIWANKSHYEENKETMSKIIQSFREIPQE